MDITFKSLYKTRIRYVETDQMGIVHHSNYYAFMEAARTELFINIGYPLTRLEERGMYFPLSESYCKYINKAMFEDIIITNMSVGFINKASIRFDYCITNDNNEILAKGYTVHLFVNKEWKILRFPENIKNEILKYLTDKITG